jgi:hypothetical protein
MNWDAVGALAELIAAIGVIASIVYLAIQIRDNTKSNRVVARQNTTRQLADYIDLLLIHPDLGSVHDKGRVKLEELTPEEAVQFGRLMRKSFWYFSAQYYQYTAGAIDTDEWGESLKLIHTYIADGGVQQWWYERGGRDHSSPSLAKFIDKEIAVINNTRQDIEVDENE